MRRDGLEDEVVIYNVDAIESARLTRLFNGNARLRIEWRSEGSIPFEDRINEDVEGQSALDLAAHLMLVGVDIGGAWEALLNARPGMYDFLVRPTGPGLPDCEHCGRPAHPGIDCGTLEVIEKSDTGERDVGFRAAVNELRERQQREIEEAQRAGAAVEVVGSSADRGACRHGENCKPFPRCNECAYKDRRDLTADDLTGERTSQARHVAACELFQKMTARDAVYGRDFCGISDAMGNDPACALCPFLKIG